MSAWSLHPEPCILCRQAACRGAAEDAYTEELGVSQSQLTTAAGQVAAALVSAMQVRCRCYLMARCGCCVHALAGAGEPLAGMHLACAPKRL